MTPPLPFYPCGWSWVLLWRCCQCLLQKWEFFVWKPIIYTCDYRSVWLNCISFIIPYQKASVIFLLFWELPSLDVGLFPNRFRWFPLTPLLGESRNKNNWLSCPKLQKLCSLVISKVAFSTQICNRPVSITENWSEEMIGRNKSLNNSQILSFMTS